MLAVHPDDESLAAGGLIQQALERKAAVRVIVITNGENNPWPQRFAERRWRIDDAARLRWGRRRGSEVIAALGCLGLAEASVAFWRYPDLGLTNLILNGNPEFCEKLAAEIREWQPTVVVAPALRDLHPDHSACAVMLRFMQQLEFGRFKKNFEVLEYLVHPSRGESGPGEVRLRLTPEQVVRKRRAILHHETQMSLSRRRFLAFAQEREVFDLPQEKGAMPPGPVLSAGWASGRLCIGVKCAKADASFILVALRRTSFVTYRIEVSAAGEVALCQPVGGHPLARGRIVRCDASDQIFLPGNFFRDASQLFVKREGGWSIFDRMGWQEVVLSSDAGESALTPSASSSRGVVAIVPCYNVDGTCGSIVRAAADFADRVIAVNDGSTDGTLKILAAVQKELGDRVTVLGWPVNRGKGAALLEAFRQATSQWPGHVVVTLDGDGQHRPRDIASLARTLIEGNCDLVIGERLAREKMPLRSRLGNGLTAALLKRIYPASPTDTQSGFRAFAPEFVEEILENISGGRYETELQILLLALRQRRPIGSVTIPTVYIDDNRLSHFRPLVDSWRVYRALFRRSFR